MQLVDCFRCKKTRAHCKFSRRVSKSQVCSLSIRKEANSPESPRYIRQWMKTNFNWKKAHKNKKSGIKVFQLLVLFFFSGIFSKVFHRNCTEPFFFSFICSTLGVIFNRKREINQSFYIGSRTINLSILKYFSRIILQM